VVERSFVLPAQRRVVAFQQEGSGELTGLEFHLSPALTGTMRQVVAEFYYDGGAAVPLSPGKDAEQVAEWTIPAAGVTLPGSVVLEIACTSPGKKAGDTAGKAQLALDCATAGPHF